MTTPSQWPAAPVAPGATEPTPLWPPQTAPPARPRRRLPTWAAVAVGVLLGAGGAVGVGAIRDSGLLNSNGVTELEAVADDCQERANYGGEIGDGGRTLHYDMRGEDDDSGGSVRGLQCVLDGLNTPDYVIGQIESTRALDGRQEATWDGYEASWTYHPDTGVDLLIRMV